MLFYKIHPQQFKSSNIDMAIVPTLAMVLYEPSMMTKNTKLIS